MIAQADKDVAKRRSTRPGSSLAGRAGIDKSDQRVRRMFASIARRYDFLNHLLSLNIDRSWRTFTTRVVAPVAGVPCSTAAPERPTWPWRTTAAGRGHSPIVGTDFCREMLVLGPCQGPEGRRGRAGHARGGGHPALARAQRHLRRGERGVRPAERARHGPRRRRDDPRRPAGRQGRDPRVFASARDGFWAGSTSAFFRHLLPRVGQALAPNQDGAYDYLPRSVLEFPDGQAMLDLLAARGLTELKQYPLTGGIATLYVGTKPVATGRVAIEGAEHMTRAGPSSSVATTWWSR